MVKSVKSYDNPWQQPRAGRAKWARRAKKEGLIADLPKEMKKTNGKVLLFLGCTAAYDINVKQVAVSTINILETLGIDYGIFGKDEKCCGSVMLRMGDGEFERIAGDNIKMFNEAGFETLISSCSGCFKTIKEDYPKVGNLNFEVLHTVEFLRRLYEDGQLKFKTPVNKKVTYHDPCHLGRASGVYDDPRFIMEAIPGLELIEMPRNREYSRCCGAGGGLKSGYPDIQNKMAQRRVREAEETGAEELVSACPFCYQGLNVGITATQSPLVMRDISFLVEESLQAETAEEPKKERKVRKARKPREPKTRKTVKEGNPISGFLKYVYWMGFGTLRPRKGHGGQRQRSPARGQKSRVRPPFQKNRPGVCTAPCLGNVHPLQKTTLLVQNLPALWSDTGCQLPQPGPMGSGGRNRYSGFQIPLQQISRSNGAAGPSGAGKLCGHQAGALG